MPVFTYRAKDRSGKLINGTVDAADTHSAASVVREMGYWPLDITLSVQPAATETTSPERGGRGIPIWSGAPIRAQALFFRQLATMLQAGMAIGEALDNVARQRGMGRLQGFALRAAEHIRAGGMLSQILAQYSGLFSKMQIGLVRAGETGGMLDSMIERIATYLEREMALRHKFSRSTFYPKILLVFILVVPIFVPEAKRIIDGGAPVVIAILRAKVLPIALWVAAIYILLKLVLTLPGARLVWDTFKLAVPVVGGVTNKLAMSRFSMTLSVMYSAGVPLAQAVELSADAMGNEVLRRAVLHTAPQIRAGGHLSEALGRTRRIPEMVLGMISTGERTGSLNQVLDKVSEYYDNEAETTIEKLGYVLFVLLILAAGIAVAFIVIGFYTKYASGITAQ